MLPLVRSSLVVLQLVVAVQAMTVAAADKVYLVTGSEFSCSK
jgi:hypothetical protein